MRRRLATPEDAEAITRIYNEGIEDRVATFETERRSPEEVRARLESLRPAVVIEEDGEVVAFAWSWPTAPSASVIRGYWTSRST